jgi:hypothetical protein
LAPFQSVMSATLACHAHLDIGGGASRSSACEPCSTRFERRRCSPSPRRRRARWRFLADPRAASSSSCAKCLRSLLIDAFARARVLDQATNIRLRQTKARCVVNDLALLGRGLERRPHCKRSEGGRPERDGRPERERPDPCSPVCTTTSVSRRRRRALGFPPRQRSWAAKEE